MNKEYLKTLCEATQSAGHLSKILVSGEQAMNDGELALCQKYTKEAQVLLSSMINDTFEELTEKFTNKTQDVNDYDIPTTLELLKQISLLIYHSGMIMDLLVDEQSNSILTNFENQLQKTINTIIEINNSIYNN